MRRALALAVLLTLVPTLTWGQPELRSGPKGATPGASITSTAAGANRQPLDVILRDSNGDILGILPVSGPLTDAQLRASPVPVEVSGTVPVTGTFWQATQPVSAATLPLPTGAATETTLNTLLKPADTLTAVGSITNPVAVTGTFWQATQPVSGTFWQGTQPVSAASLPLPAGAATEATLAGALTTTAHDAAFGVAGTPDAQVRSVQGVAGGTAVPVSGTFWQATQPVSGTFWQATQPVSAASLPLPTGAATETTLASLDGKVTVVNTGAIAGTVTANAGTNLNTSALLTTAAHDAALGIAGTPDAQVRSIQGIAGMTAVVVDGSGVTQPISGTVTANAGTNLNTSALALETGGNLATLAGVVTSSRAAVNPISGQAGVQGGAGAVTALTQRVALATDANTIQGTVTANPATYAGKTLTYVSVNQGAAGTTTLANASASNKHKVVGIMLTMSAAGTLKFTDGVGDLTGPMDVATTGGFVSPTSMLPYFETGAINRALNLVTATGAARGVVIILTEP